MSDASSKSSRSTVTSGHGKRLSEKEIRDILYDDGAMDDDLDYDPETLPYTYRGFSDIGSNTSSVDDPSTSSEGVTRRGFAASATCWGKRQGVSQQQDNDDSSPSTSGVCGEDMAEIDYFLAYFDNEFMIHLVTETNQYAHSLIDAGILPASRFARWKDPHNWCLHFENNANEGRHDRLWKVQKVFSDMMGKFRNYFVTAQNVVIDESLVLFNGQLAFKYLLAHNTGICGTVKAHRKEIPVFGISIAVGDCQLHKYDNMLSVRWRDRREVNMLTTIHTGGMLDSGKVYFQMHFPIYKPDCVIDYSMNMRLVDKCDMMLSAVECMRKSVKWMKKFFFHLIDVAVLNCFNIYLNRHRQKEKLQQQKAMKKQRLKGTQHVKEAQDLDQGQRSQG
ncbi:piggyBac transposable element-derived protein 4-like [Procambarus clarkii]|uniref:piggyBac transposable element-derived protein 4-like n=1 Tax=Procambarus clarkii TaxID=6728 RepID=UPI0037449BFD